MRGGVSDRRPGCGPEGWHVPALSFVKVHSFCETVSSECTSIRFKYVIFKSVIFFFLLQALLREVLRLWSAHTGVDGKDPSVAEKHSHVQFK